MLRKPVSNIELNLYIDLLKDFYPSNVFSYEDIKEGLAVNFEIEVSIEEIKEVRPSLSEDTEIEDLRLIRNNIV